MINTFERKFAYRSIILKEYESNSKKKYSAFPCVLNSRIQKNYINSSRNLNLKRKERPFSNSFSLPKNSINNTYSKDTKLIKYNMSTTLLADNFFFFRDELSSFYNIDKKTLMMNARNPIVFNKITNIDENNNNKIRFSRNIKLDTILDKQKYNYEDELERDPFISDEYEYILNFKNLKKKYNFFSNNDSKGSKSKDSNEYNSISDYLNKNNNSTFRKDMHLKRKYIFQKNKPSLKVIKRIKKYELKSGSNLNSSI